MEVVTKRMGLHGGLGKPAPTPAAYLRFSQPFCVFIRLFDVAGKLFLCLVRLANIAGFGKKAERKAERKAEQNSDGTRTKNTRLATNKKKPKYNLMFLCYYSALNVFF